MNKNVKVYGNTLLLFRTIEFFSYKRMIDAGPLNIGLIHYPMVDTTGGDGANYIRTEIIIATAMKAVMILLISLFLVSCSRVEPKNVQETPLATSASIDSEKDAEFNEVANQFGSFLVLHDTASVYDMLTDEKKSMLTTDEFSRRYSRIYKEFGLESAQVRTIDGSGEKRDVTYYLNYDDGNARASEHFGFSLVNGRWSFEGMKDLFYAFCEKDPDCNPDVLSEVCDKTCASTGDLRKLEKAYFWCSNFVCACKCLRLRGGVEVYPNWNLLENPNLGVVTKEVRPDLSGVTGKL